MTGFAGRNMKRAAAILLCSAALGLTAYAQTGTEPGQSQDQTQGPPPPRQGGRMGGRGAGGMEQRLTRMQSELSLTPDQTEKIKTILTDGRTEMMAARNDSSASQDDKRAKMAGMMRSENEKIKAVLTPDQKKKFEEMEKKQREEMRERRANGGGGPPQAPPQN